MPTISLATKNQHKVMELQTLLGSEWTLIPAPPEVDWEETGRSFRANALIKAEALRAECKNLVLADDSGLEVFALNGAPGIYSARYAGANAKDTDNLKKLLRVMEGLPEQERRARFVCVLCLIEAEGEIHYFEGSCEGSILPRAAGTGGFGYDPIFRPEGYDKTFGELGEGLKNQISHRAKALAELRTYLDSHASLRN